MQRDHDVEQGLMGSEVVDAASGAVELRFKGPSKVRFGIEAVVRDAGALLSARVAITLGELRISSRRRIVASRTSAACGHPAGWRSEPAQPAKKHARRPALAAAAAEAELAI